MLGKLLPYEPLNSRTRRFAVRVPAITNQQAALFVYNISVKTPEPFSTCLLVPRRFSQILFPPVETRHTDFMLGAAQLTLKRASGSRPVGGAKMTMTCSRTMSLLAESCVRLPRRWTLGVWLPSAPKPYSRICGNTQSGDGSVQKELGAPIDAAANLVELNGEVTQNVETNGRARRQSPPPV
jgi:hypothetical protein